MQPFARFIPAVPPQFFSVLLLLACQSVFCQDLDKLKLKDYRPVSIYQAPQHLVQKARYPVVDFHSHDDHRSAAAIEDWVRTMDETGVSKSIILSYNTGPGFDSVFAKYSKYKDRFEVWCGFDNPLENHEPVGSSIESQSWLVM